MPRQTELTFVDRLPAIAVADPLAEFLGVLRPGGGSFRYTYEDAVKLCGHSCPVVARAWAMTAAALRVLYPGELPVRGDLEVAVGGSPDDGTSGPMARVVELVTGAAPATGFGGILGRWSRRNLLRFDPSLAGRIRFRRVDTGAEVEATCAVAPATPELREMTAEVLEGEGAPGMARRLARLWQERVEEILTGAGTRVVRLPRATELEGPAAGA